MMNRPEFLRGWLLLTSQPFGRSYRSDIVTGVGEPSPAKIQAELYYKNLNYAYPPAWVEVAELLASGDHWPSLTECKEALKYAKAKPIAAMITQDSGELPSTTKEEFGLSLYGAIQTISELRHAKDEGKPQLRAQLSSYLDALTSDELARVVAHYPDMVSL